MIINELKLQNFRNYNSLDLEFSPKINIFYGKNAQGKTNLLEAISCLGLGRSFRTKKDVELIKWSAEVSYLKGYYQSKDYQFTIEVGIGLQEKRIKVDGRPVKNSEAFGQVPVINFAPDDLQIIKGGPQFRRDFLDIYLAQIEPEYRSVYYRFYKVLQQRNKLLKDPFRNSAELEIWDEQLVEHGVKVILFRLKMIDQAKPYIIKAHQLISGGQELLDLDYLSFNNQQLKMADESQLKELFSENIKLVKKNEFDRCLTLTGPHRDDLRLTLDQKVDLRNFGSQGQQRTAALALKLGLIELIKESRGEFPIILLDDVMSEFDDSRKQSLLQVLVSSAQTFLTSTSQRDFPVTEAGSVFFRVEEGVIYNG